MFWKTSVGQPNSMGCWCLRVQWCQNGLRCILWGQGSCWSLFGGREHWFPYPMLNSTAPNGSPKVCTSCLAGGEPKRPLWGSVAWEGEFRIQRQMAAIPAQSTHWFSCPIVLPPCLSLAVKILPSAQNGYLPLGAPEVCPSAAETQCRGALAFLPVLGVCRWQKSALRHFCDTQDWWFKSWER